MKLPVALARMLARFDALSMRERALVAGAGLIGMVLIWFAVILDPMSAQQRLLSAELTTLQQSIQLTTLSIQETADTDPTMIAQREETKIKAQLAEINTQLAAKSAGLIPPERMVQVIHDVLSRQRGVALVSLHNSPVTTLVPAAAGQTAPSGGPYVHPVEIVVEGTLPRRARLPARIGKPRVALLLAPARARKHRISPQPSPHRAQHAEPRQGLDRRLEDATRHESNAPPVSCSAAADDEREGCRRSPRRSDPPAASVGYQRRSVAAKACDVEAVLRSKERDLAIVNGKIVRAGDHVSGVQIEAILVDGVRYVRDGQVHVARLQPASIPVRR